MLSNHYNLSFYLKIFKEKEEHTKIKARKKKKEIIKIRVEKKQRIEKLQRKINNLNVGSLKRSTELTNFLTTLTKKKKKLQITKIKNERGDIIIDFMEINRCRKKII